MAVKIAFVNNKGGSTKTTSLVNIAGALSTKYPEKRILIIDGDAQGNAARSFNIDSSELEDTIYDVFLGNIEVDKPIVNVYENIDLIPANPDMNYLEFDMMELYTKEQNLNMFKFYNELRSSGNYEKMDFDEFSERIPNNLTINNSYFNMLKGKLNKVDKKYDFILFDTPPELKAVTSSILAVSDHVIIPYEPDVYSMDGIFNIIQRIKWVQDNLNKNLKIAGLLGAKIKKQTKLHNEVIANVLKYCMKNDINYFENEIPNSIRYASATAYKGVPVTIAEPNTPYSQAYIGVTEELIELI